MLTSGKRDNRASRTAGRFFSPYEADFEAHREDAKKLSVSDDNRTLSVLNGVQVSRLGSARHGTFENLLRTERNGAAFRFIVNRTIPAKL